MFEIHYDLIKEVYAVTGVLNSQRTTLTSFPPNTHEYQRKCFMANTMVYQKFLSNWHWAIRVCDHCIAGAFQMKRVYRVFFFLIASMIMSTVLRLLKKMNGLPLTERRSTAGKRSAVTKVNGKSLMVL